MARHNSAADVKQQHLKAMGSVLGPIYHGLYTDIVWLHAKWQQFRKLFADSPDEVAMQNRAAGFLFWILDDVMWNDVLLHLARLVDPAQSLRRADKANLTLLALPDAISDQNIAAETKVRVNEAKIRCKFAVDWRHRHIAHRDLGLILGSGAAKPLAPASRAHVEHALVSVRHTMTPAYRHYMRMPDPGFERFTPPGDDADALQHFLRVGLEKSASPGA
jgi:hypothetical protein